MNTTKAIIILVIFVVGLIFGSKYFVTNTPSQEEVIYQESITNENGEMYPITIDAGVEIPSNILYYNPAGGTIEVGKTPDQLCENFGGEWSIEFSECLGVGSNVCMEIGGNWNECASACRNNPNAEICTMQCVQVCNFKEIPLEVQ